MADQDVGGIGVKFTAEATQLQQELQKIEQRLRAFDSAHGQKRIRLQADLVMPGNRKLADFRRDIEKSFGAQGSAGQIKARVDLLPPTAAQIRAFRGSVGEIRVPVVGDFKWGKQPPKTVEVTVVEKTESGRRAGTGGTITQQVATARAAEVKPSREEILRSREAYRRAERLREEGGGARGFVGPFGGARGFADRDEFFREQARTERRRQMRTNFGAGQVQPRNLFESRATYDQGPGTPQQQQARISAIDEALGRPPRSAYESPFAYPPSFQSQLRPRVTARGAAVGGSFGYFDELTQRAAAGAPPGAFAGPRAAQRFTHPAFRPTITQAPAVAMAAEPGKLEVDQLLKSAELSPRVRASLEQAVAEGTEAGMGGAGDGGNGPRQPAAPPPEEPGDVVGRPSPSARAFARAGLGPTGAPLISEAGTPLARVEQLLKTSREAVQLAQGTGQVRAVGTTTGGLFANIFGGKAQRELVARDITTLRHALEDFTSEGTDARQAFDRVADAQTRFNRAQLSGRGNMQALTKELQEARSAAQPYAETVEAIGTRIEHLQGQISPLKQAAVGFVSSIAGTIVGLGVFNAVANGLSVAGTSLGEVIERQTGYNNIANQTVSALSDQTRALHGWANEAVAAQASVTGMSDATADFVHSLLDQRVAGEAANKNLVEQNALFQSALAIRRQSGQLPSGVDASALQTTGGLNIFGLQTPLFGTPSAQEILGRQLGGERFADITTFNPNSIAQQVFSGNVTGAIGRGGQRISPVTGAGTIPALAVGLTELFRNPNAIPDSARGPGVNTLRGVDPQQVRDFADSVDMVNAAMDKAADTGLRFAANTGDLSDAQLKAAQEESRRQADLVSQAGAPDLSRAIRQAGGRLLLQGLTGNNANQIVQIQRAAAQYQQGALLPNRGEAAAAQSRQIGAQLQLNQMQGRLQRESIIPGQSFLRQLAAGRAPTGGAINIPNPLTAGTATLPPGVINQPGIDTSRLTEGLGQVQTQANSGRDALTGMIKAADDINRRAGISSNLLGSFESLTKAAGATAAAIRQISQASAWMQVNLQVKQINEQIYLMSRSLADAKSFLSGVGDGELGILQHRARALEISQAELGFRQQELSVANQLLGVEASSLQLTQRQRQINFQRAIAGFVAPGQTPEEIAARQRQAELEADFAQRQQDISVRQLDNQKESIGLAQQQLAISKEQFAVQQAMVDVSAERAIGDLSRAIGLLQEQARVTVQLQVNSDAIDAYQAVLDEQMAQIQSVIEEAYNVQQTVMSNAAALAASYGGRLTEWNNLIISHLADYLQRATDLLGGYSSRAGQRMSGAPGAPSGSYSGTSTNSAGFAPGFYGSVSGATQMTVGEAGPETIAILRNPRSMTMQPQGGGGWGGAPTIIVNVTGNNIGTEQDAEALANTIARKVEESMSRRSSLLGLRVN